MSETTRDIVIRIETQLKEVVSKVDKIEEKMNGTNFERLNKIADKFSENESLTHENRKILWFLGTGFFTIILGYVATKIF